LGRGNLRRTNVKGLSKKREVGCGGQVGKGGGMGKAGDGNAGGCEKEVCGGHGPNSGGVSEGKGGRKGGRTGERGREEMRVDSHQWIWCAPTVGLS